MIGIGLGSQAATAAAPFGLRGTLQLDGNSTLHRFSARTTDVRGVVYMDEEAMPAQPADVAALVRAGRVKSFDLVAPVEKLTSGDSGLDKNMWKALKSAEFKTIRFRADNFQILPADVRGATFRLAMRGALTVAGVTRPVAIEADGFGAPGGVRIAGSTSLRMTDYAVKPPTFMLGAIRTANEVVVKFDMELRASR
ncbi:MAG TPA: YceI family protein [Polyangia bacterium]|nr:YceI family protein [Polyangia bacterium]